MLQYRCETHFRQGQSPKYETKPKQTEVWCYYGLDFCIFSKLWLECQQFVFVYIFWKDDELKHTQFSLLVVQSLVLDSDVEFDVDIDDDSDFEIERTCQYDTFQ